jgi:hypothetical protein
MRVSIRSRWIAVAITCLTCALGTSTALATGVERPGWELTTNTYPTHLLPSKTPGEASGTIEIDVFNVGAAGSQGTITVTDTLPPGVKAKAAGELVGPGRESGAQEWGTQPLITHEKWDCTGNGTGALPAVAGASVVTCTNNPVGLRVFQGGGGVPYFAGNNPQPPVGIEVEAGTEASGLTNRASITGGGAAAPASTRDALTVSAVPAAAGLTGWDTWFSNADGTIDSQAGGHPYEMTTVFDLATRQLATAEGVVVGGEPRNLEVRLPPGLVGDLAAVPQCTRSEIYDGEAGDCPAASMVGRLEAGTFILNAIAPVYNMVPPPGVVAEFGFVDVGVRVFISFSVRTGGDNGITAHITNIAQRQTQRGVLTLWGVPGEHSHDRWRARVGEGGCTQEEMERSPVGESEEDSCTAPQFPSMRPILTLPTACGEPQPFLVRELSTWQNPNANSELSSVSHDDNGSPEGFTGCQGLGFAPSITASPDTARADTPAGLTVEVKPPLGGLEVPGLLGTADLENTTVTLPPGLVINPGQAAGLQACSRTEAALEPLPGGEENDGPPACPNAAKVGTVLIQTPLLGGAAEKQLEGDVYVLQSNPPELKLLLTASADGVNLKLVGAVHLDEQTGQVTAKFEGTPQLPFTLFKLSFSGGAQAALDTPSQCGTYTANADFTPWSSPFSSDFLTSASFSLSEGPGGGVCPSDPMPFSPSLTAGSTTDQAGGFTSFSLLLQRGDGQQRIEKLQFKVPAGLSGMLSSVPLCGEADANAGTCGAGSHIGHAVVTSGPGPYPLVIPQPGAPEAPIYLTGPYKGAPFGLSIAVPVIAGPFNLGTIVTRASISVDPSTAQITVTTDALPQIVKGVPTDLREVDAVIDRPGFMFNPTNCTQQSSSGIATSTQGVQAAISSPFGVGSCQSLGFAPKFAVSTSARSSRAGGASLTAKLSYPVGSQGKQANISKVKVDLPKQLPSRLTTLQKACLASQFAANPAGCPPGSLVGHAVVHTPLLPVALSGPAYFVSHGGEAFPSLTLVLQGDGVTVELVGTTFISKAGITSSTFKTVPDVPFSSFELVLPVGKHSALAANLPASAHGSMCGQHLSVPTAFVAQNGRELHQSTPVSVTGCARTKALTRTQKLAAALKACKKKAKGRRAACEGAARRQLEAAKKNGRKK